MHPIWLSPILFQTYHRLCKHGAPQGSEATDQDLDATNVQLCEETIWTVFEKLGIEWKAIEERIIMVVSDGAGTMGAYAGTMGAYADALNAIREKGGQEPIGS